MSFFFGSPMRNRTADSAVRGQRLNRLTMRPFFIVIEISLFMITYFFVFCKCLHARCGKILKFCLSGKDLNIFSKKTFTEILHILFFAIYLRRNHCSGGEYQKESGLFLSATGCGRNSARRTRELIKLMLLQNFILGSLATITCGKAIWTRKRDKKSKKPW